MGDINLDLIGKWGFHSVGVINENQGGNNICGGNNIPLITKLNDFFITYILYICDENTYKEELISTPYFNIFNTRGGYNIDNDIITMSVNSIGYVRKFSLKVITSPINGVQLTPLNPTKYGIYYNIEYIILEKI